MLRQLTLSLGLRDSHTFANFYSKNNLQLVSQLENVSQPNSDQYIYMWGEQGTGRTHLLQACCHSVTKQGHTSFYLPLASHKDLKPEMLEDLSSVDCVCIDDIQSVCGNSAWEEALFHLYNETQTNNTKLIISGNKAPAHLEIKLADLKSRLSQGVIFQVGSLSDEDKQAVLIMRAKRRGMKLTNEVAHYLLNHWDRDIHALINLLDKLDEASLASKRHLTIPFVKEVLSSVRD